MTLLATIGLMWCAIRHLDAALRPHQARLPPDGRSRILKQQILPKLPALGRRLVPSRRGA